MLKITRTPLILIFFLGFLALSEISEGAESDKFGESSDETGTPAIVNSENLLKVQPALVPPVRTFDVKAIQSRILGRTTKEKSPGSIKEKTKDTGPEKNNPGR